MRMLKAEWKTLFQNRKLLIVVIGLLFIPMIYASIFLKASWNPFGNTENIPVAVVNEDAAAEYNGETLKIGDELIEKLQEDESLGWEFTDRKTAMDGVENGEYYMSIIIPENFSAYAATVFEDEPKQMDLEYYTNAGRSFMVKRISESAAEHLDREIAETVTKQYAQAMLGQLQDLNEGMHEAADGAADLESGNEQLEDNLVKLSESTVTFKNGLGTAEEGSDEIAVHIASAASGAEELSDGLAKYTDGVNELHNGLVKYTEGTEKLHTGIVKYTNNVSALDDGLHQYSVGMSTLTEGLKNYASGLEDYQSGVEEYTSGVARLDTGLTQQLQGAELLSENNEELVEGSSQLSEALSDQVAPGIDQVENGAKTLAGKGEELNQGISTLYEGSKELKEKVDVLAQSLKGSSEQADELVQGLYKLKEQLAQNQPQSQSEVNTTEMNEALAAVTDNIDKATQQLKQQKQTNDTQLIETVSNMDNLDEEQKQAVINELKVVQSEQSVTLNTEQLTGSVEKLSSAIQSSEKIGTSSNSEESVVSIGGLINGAQQLRDGNKLLESSIVGQEAGTLQGSISEFSSNLGSLYDSSAQFGDGLQSLAENTTMIKSGIDEIDQGAQVLNEGIELYTGGVNQLRDGAAQLESGASKLNEQSSRLLHGSEDLMDGSEELTNGSERLAGQSGTLTEGSDKLVRAGEDLSSGSAELDESGETLASGSESLSQNSQSLNKGADELSGGMSQLQGGAESLHSGLEELEGGSQELNDGAHQLNEGSNELLTGTSELAKRLREGSEALNGVQSENDNADMFSSPTHLENHEVSNSPNYGYGMAPYMMSVALFLGAIVVCLLFPVGVPSSEPTGGFAWWFSKFSVLLFVSILQAVIMTSILLWIGLDPFSAPELFLVAIVTSMAFMALVQFFAVVFGNPGRFIVLIMMVMQLSAAGGAFPVELLSGFFQQVNPFLPMTYSIDVFRQVISLNGSAVPDLMILAGIFLFFHLGTLVFFAVKAKKRQNFTEQEA
ncbi:YhgE/Pip domain-containing protein [Sediminibacillus massiliensis]|uniref:YhgE/Pip domain-containing protein n=1 Tax=Sediminibacillus massiliensis TaxID=1926277 RepID=UPI0009889388|nr:YhgE/Pip domain-containing protein [Sediminibacillus massiliensis]